MTLYEYEAEILAKEYSEVKYLVRKDSHSKALLEKRDGRRLVALRIKKPFDIAVYRALTEIENENLCTVCEVSENDQEYLVLEEFCEGVPLSELVGEKLSESEAVFAAMSVANALYALNSRGIVHRDIKPENIVISAEKHIKLIDFNISRIYKDTSSSDTKMLGTIGYAAPEQFGITQSDIRSDIYSVGVLLNMLLVGEHPVVKMSRNKVIKPVLDRCLKINPADRYGSAEELYRELEKIKPKLR